MKVAKVNPNFIYDIEDFYNRFNHKITVSENIEEFQKRQIKRRNFKLNSEDPNKTFEEKQLDDIARKYKRGMENVTKMESRIQSTKAMKKQKKEAVVEADECWNAEFEEEDMNDHLKPKDSKVQTKKIKQKGELEEVLN